MRLTVFSKFILMGLCLSFGSVRLFAETGDEVNAKAKIERVTLYRQGAKVSCEAKANLPQGRSYLVLQGLCQGIQPNSIQVKISNSNITFLSATPRINYLKVTDNIERYKKVEDSLEVVKKELDKLNVKINALAARRQVLMGNNPLEHGKKETTFTVEQMRQFMDFRQKELLQIDNEQLQFSYLKKSLDEDVNRHQTQLNSLAAARQRPTGELVLQLQSAQGGNVDLECSFMVNEAGWTPLYDIRTEGLDKPVRLDYKAQVYQVTGIDWKQIKMTLSTANPKQSHDRPILSPVYVDFGASVAYDDFYNSRYASPSAAASLEDRSEALNSAYAHDMARAAQGSPKPSPIPNLTTSGNDGVVEFEIQTAQDLYTDRNASVVPVMKYDIPAEYEYHSVPKIDNGAFMLARLTDYGQYNLLPGRANIFQEGMYLGQVTLNPQVANDTLYISLGRDEKIVVKRDKIKDLSSVKSLGSSQRESYGFEISIRNNKNKEITVDLLDQIPVSKQKDIEVKLLESEQASFVEELGSLRWKLKIGAGQTAKVRFAYHIKYPKSKQIVLTKQ